MTSTRLTGVGKSSATRSSKGQFRIHPFVVASVAVVSSGVRGVAFAQRVVMIPPVVATRT